MGQHDHIALEVSGVSKRFVKSDGLHWPWKRKGSGRKPVVAVNHVSFQVRRGEVFGILGPNGSGKSTLVRCIATLLLPDEGCITVFGHDVLREEMAVKQLINRVSVEASFFKKLTPMENLLYGARLYGLGAQEARKRALKALERLGLKKETIFRPMEEMSRGMQQKVAIARAFLTRPILLLLDEPTTGLDPRSKRDVQAFMEELRDTHDATILLTTHDMQEADTFIGAATEAVTGQAIDTNYMILYLLVGTLVWHYLAVVFDNVSEMIAWERWEGTIEYTFMAPISRFTHMIGQTLFSLVYGLLHTGIILGVVALFFRLDLSHANLLGGLLLLMAGSLSFIGLGIIASVLPLLFPERGAQMTHVIQALLLLISGVYFPISVLPEWMQPLARISPATYVLEGMRAALLDQAGTSALLGHLGRLVLIGTIAMPVGIAVFRQAERYAKRTGKLKRSG
jgi:ABC-type multidrug transport system ATPase subunit/ABC-type multidrug transport system permease subunit